VSGTIDPVRLVVNDGLNTIDIDTTTTQPKIDFDNGSNTSSLKFNTLDPTNFEIISDGNIIIDPSNTLIVNGDLDLSDSLNFSDFNSIQLIDDVWYSNKVTAGSINYIPVPTNSYSGGVLANDGLIYCIPNSTNVLIINSNNGTITFDNTTITGSFGSYRGGALADNGNIYCAPVSYTTNTILVIEPSTQTTRTIGPYSVSGTSNQYFGATKGLDGKIYFAPQANPNLLIVDPTVFPEIITEIPIPGFVNVGQYSDAVTGQNGKIYFIPWNSDKVLVYNPTGSVFTQITDPLMPAGGSKWSSGVITDNGFIYCSPRQSTTVLIIDTNTDTLDLTSITDLSSNATKYYGSSIGNDGNIYFTPFGIDNILKINPSNNTVEYIPVNLTVTNGWLGSVVANDGNIIHIPFGSSDILVQNPINTLQINGNTNINGNLFMSADLDMSCNLIQDVSGIYFCDGTYIGEGSSFDIYANQELHISSNGNITIDPSNTLIVY
ncbi:MAG: hypothetical protein ACO3UU_08095, partial [Minisyncoccia bacterium]